MIVIRFFIKLRFLFYLYDITLCAWNINGVKNKFKADGVKNLIKDINILIIVETHFNIRQKCPENFYLVGRSKMIPSEKPRGGIALYKNFNCRLKLHVIEDNLPDCIIVEICESSIILVGLYIPPNNSAFFCDEYFHSLQATLENYCKYRDVVVIGDLNSRIGDSFSLQRV